MKFRIFCLLLFCLVFSGAGDLLAQATTNDEPNKNIVEDIALEGSGIFTDDVILLGDADPGPLASNYQVPEDNEGTDDTSPLDDDDEPFDLWAWLTGFINGLIPESVVGYFGAFLLVGETVVRLTPTKEDDKWFLWFKRIIDTIFPSRQASGGTFPKSDKTPI